MNGQPSVVGMNSTTNEQNRVKSAILAVFPTPEAFELYSRNQESSDAVRSFVDLAFRNGIILEQAQDQFIKFIEKNARSAKECTPGPHLNFDQLLEKKEQLLELKSSIRTLTNRINALIAGHGIALPNVSNSMLTRLKSEPADTVHKQNALRGLAFWIGYERPHIGPQWNFETLFKICYEYNQSVNYKDGVRVGFALDSRGDVIGYEIVKWLKNEIKFYVEKIEDRSSYCQWSKVKSHDIVTLYVDFPKVDKASNPESYRECISRAVSVSHQLAIRWSLSNYYAKNIFLSIGIAIGDYSVLNNYLLPILNVKLPDDPTIRMTELARHCLLVNDIRAEFCSQPKELTLFNGEAFRVWWVEGLWSLFYCELIPGLLEDPVLQDNPTSVEMLTQIIWSSTHSESKIVSGSSFNSVSRFYKFPHNSLLGIEIANTLFYRRRFWEAFEILNTVICLNPNHLNARTLRMIILRNLALRAPSFPIADNLLKQAEEEALFIQNNCFSRAEDFYVEYASIYLSKAILSIQYMRECQGPIAGIHHLEKSKQIVFHSLDTVENLLRQGMTIPSAGLRSGYILNCVKILKRILECEDRIFIDPEHPIDSKPDIVRQASIEHLWERGYLRSDLPVPLREEFLEGLLKRKFNAHYEAVSLVTYRSSLLFCYAVALWNFIPKRTVANTRTVVQLLKEAIRLAYTVQDQHLCVYSHTRIYGEMMTAEKFVQHIEKSIKMIEGQAGDDLFDRDGREEIVSNAEFSSLLFTLNT